MLVPTARKLAKTLGALVYEGIPCKQGHTVRYTNNCVCVVCNISPGVKALRKQHYAANKYWYVARAEAWKIANKERHDENHRLHYAENVDLYKSRSAEHRAANLEQRNEYTREWYRKNKKRVLANTRARQAGLKQRTPLWSDRIVLHSIYEKCPAGFHVDHVIPLHGKTVSGLHVPENLQYLTAEQNLRKGAAHG